MSKRQYRRSNTALSNYLSAHEIRRSDFAAKVGCSEQHLDKLCCGLRRPSGPLGLRIEQVTLGEVTYIQMVNDHKTRIRVERAAKEAA